MKNSDLKRFFETDSSNNNEGFARLNPTGALNAPVSSNKISTGNAAEGMLMAADGEGGVKFVEQGGGGGSDPYVTTFGRFIDYYPRTSGNNDMLTYVKALNPYPNKTIGELKQELNNNSIIDFGIMASAGNATYPVMEVYFEIDGNGEIGFYINIGDGEDELTEFTDEDTINGVVTTELSFITDTSVNPSIAENDKSYPVVSPTTFCEYVFAANGDTQLINTKTLLQVTDVSALLEEHHE